MLVLVLDNILFFWHALSKEHAFIYHFIIQKHEYFKAQILRFFCCINSFFKLSKEFRNEKFFSICSGKLGIYVLRFSNNSQ